MQQVLEFCNEISWISHLSSIKCYFNFVLFQYNCFFLWVYFHRTNAADTHFWQPEPLNRNESGRFGPLKSDSTHFFFRNACTKSGSVRFSQFSGGWLILSVYIIMSFYFPLLAVLNGRVAPIISFVSQIGIIKPSKILDRQRFHLHLWHQTRAL